MKTARRILSIPVTVLLALAAAVPAASSQPAQQPDSTLLLPEDFHLSHRFLRSSCEVIGFNLVMTMFGRYIMEPDGSGFVVSTHTIEENLKAGMEWDDNSFSANNWRHPYQGGMYYNAARSNGFDFYQSSAFSFAGAWLWEYTGEGHHPSYNDWVNTAVGGIMFGESFWRLSDLIIDNKATGSGRTGREIGAFLVNPMRGLNRIITGEAFAVHENPPDRRPSAFHGTFDLGLRILGKERLWKASNTKLFAGGTLIYGEKLGTTGGKPFDYFDMHIQLNFDNKPHGIGLFNINALLHGWDGGASETSESQINTYMHFTYVDNEAYTYGGQSLSASFLKRFGIGGDFRHDLEGHFEWIMLGASKSDYFNLSNREYDYGPGLGLRLYYSLMASDIAALRAFYRGSWIRSINGTAADHLDQFLGFTTAVGIRDWFRLGIDYYMYYSNRYYDDYDDVWSKNPMLQAYLTWTF